MPYVTAIGAAIADLTAKSASVIIPRDSNPGKVTQSAGGVGRNVAENLARLGADVKLVAALGGDMFGKSLLDSCESVGIDMALAAIDPAAASATYIAILDADGEMHVAVVDDACTLSKAHILRHETVIRESQIILLDTNLDEALITDILDRFPENDIYIDPISVTKSRRIAKSLGRFHTVKMNELEAAALMGAEITGEAGLRQAGMHFMALGIQRVVISLGARGLYYCTPTGELRLESAPLTPKNATGAGDAMMAGLIYCDLHRKSTAYTGAFAQAMARTALMSESAVSAAINVATIEREMGEF
ncbi:MAG: carbohydrate kinase family protein [Oscillospiraceae bacterium]|nr:carbohydrate kinase family protein [Oscillospiraceae bacterium]